MADNYTYTAGTGGTAAGDLISNVMYPRVKITLGNDGTADGDVYSARPLPIQNINGTITNVSNLDAGTITKVEGGSIAVTVGTIAAGTISVGAGTVGTIANVAKVHNAGTIAELPDLPGGTVDSLTEVANLAKGTISKVEGGSIAVTAGTGIVTNGSIVVTVGTIATGSIAVTAGTGIITSGSMAITAGTIRNDGRATRNILTYGTTFGGTAAGYGTLVGSASVGAGTYCWVNDLSIVNSKGGTVTSLVGFGTALNGPSVLAKGDFDAQGGIQKSFPLAVNAGTANQDLVAYIGAAGTIDVNVTYFISA